MYFFLKFFKNEENLKKNTSTSGCIEKYISLVKMYKKIRNRKIELKKKIIKNSFHDFSGDYTHSNEQDYPSVSQINHKVKENSVNLIFAVTEEQFGVYDLLQQNVEGSSVGTLSNDSSNIVELVKAQYQAITSSIGKNIFFG